MPKWIALLRGVNVGGKNKMSMQRLREKLELLGLSKVQTLIQSGNVVFSTKSTSKLGLAKKILDAIEVEFSFRPMLALLSESQFRQALSLCPFSTVENPKSTHFYFLDSKPKSPDLDALQSLALNSERFKLVDELFFLSAPDGIGNSKLAAAVERKLGVAGTARNLNTVTELLKMIDQQ